MDKCFVDKNSVVREIWGKADTVLFIFAGAAAEFALNKAVDWLYFTGRLPADPLGRLFSTVTYARKIIFSKEEEALKSIDLITAIHLDVERKRGEQIPAWAYRDVLFLLIDYSIRSFELLEHQLSDTEKTEVFEVFKRVGLRMQLTGLPKDYYDWQIMREAHLQQNLVNSAFTIDLYRQYKRHLGSIRYVLLIQVQQMLVPRKVKGMLFSGEVTWLYPALLLYKFTRLIKLNGFLKDALLPKAYKEQIKQLDINRTN
ncbi:oxygenase MpaB family protein [Mucilaginibacter sp.]|uniref:oxygenase MpaB family protein n=1 Tax=Mucilaginibacter sp. TaxID=1882438 RepID=UPI003D096EBB